MNWPEQRLFLRPGAALPITGQRQPVAELVLRGRLAATAPAMLGSLYALCGQAHRLCCEMALQALQAPEDRVEPNPSQRLVWWRETLREHVRRLYLDMPRWLGQSCTGAAALCDSPALAHSVQPGDSALLDWVGQQVLGMPVPDWCLACQENPVHWMLEWAHGQDNPHTQVLRQAQAWGRAWRLAPQPLGLDAGAAMVMQLAECLRASADYARAPHWQGQWRETGCWTRQGLEGWAVDDVWTRLAARVHDLAQLALPQGGHWLRAGARALGRGEAVAWCEMARGLLVHWLRVDAQGRIEHYGVLAPTEWNFHPQGAVAQLLRGLPQQVPPCDLASAVGLVVAAFDPCVDYECVAPAPGAEPLHA